MRVCHIVVVSLRVSFNDLHTYMYNGHTVVPVDK